MFDDREYQATYAYIRDRIRHHVPTEYKDAYNQMSRKDASSRKWQAVFGGRVSCPSPEGQQRPLRAPLPPAASTIGRSGRAG